MANSAVRIKSVKSGILKDIAKAMVAMDYARIGVCIMTVQVIEVIRRRSTKMNDTEKALIFVEQNG
ncbi:hypothetical protein MMC15_001132 [Xylographa vitiligo]|nr:hypothetical protein [Xylographa vitiligo]